MPIVDFETRVSSRFQCTQPQHAAPGNKRDHVLPAVYDARAPHVKVDAVIGTRGVFVERIDHNFYQGHIPDAPVLLGQAQLETYARGVEGTSWGKKRLIATAAALAVGAVLGAFVGAGFMGIGALCHLIWPAKVAGVTLAQTVLVAACYAGCGAFFTFVSDTLEWSAARRTFAFMQEAAACAVQLDAQVRRPIENDQSARLIAQARGSDSWLLQQAGLELEAARARARMPDVAKPEAASA